MLNRFIKTIMSSVVKKQLTGITGLLLCGFLVSHLAGNFLIFVGADAFNTYAYKLTSTPLIYVAEAILLGIFFDTLWDGHLSNNSKQDCSSSRLLYEATYG